MKNSTKDTLHVPLGCLPRHIGQLDFHGLLTIRVARGDDGYKSRISAVAQLIPVFVRCVWPRSKRKSNNKQKQCGHCKARSVIVLRYSNHMVVRGKYRYIYPPAPPGSMGSLSLQTRSTDTYYSALIYAASLRNNLVSQNVIAQGSGILRHMDRCAMMCYL